MLPGFQATTCLLAMSFSEILFFEIVRAHKQIEHVEQRERDKGTEIKVSATKSFSDNFNLNKCHLVTVPDSENGVLLGEVLDNGDYTHSWWNYQYTYK